jgi:aspartate carbamoyltransferase catalytic subunit
MSHFCSIKDLTRSEIMSIFNKADELRDMPAKKLGKHLSHRILANVFFEPSTRTRLSFESAAKQLGMHVLTMNENQSSRVKGESFLDTLLTLHAVGAEVFVIRTKDENICEQMAVKMTALHPGTHVINAGGGILNHPTQGLLDVYTMLKHIPELELSKIVIIGDIKHSRVARSTTQCLVKLGCTNVHLVSPEHLLPQQDEFPGCELSSSINETLQQANVVMCLRIQKERMQVNEIPDPGNYHSRFGLNAARLKLADPAAIVMHPGPMNREVEITSEIADGKQSVIEEQVKNGLYIRMALFDHFLN